MHLLRPVRSTDIDALSALVEGTGIGMTSLPRNRVSLERKVELSLRSFATGAGSEADNGDEKSFLFVLEDLTTGTVVGTTGVMAGIGLQEPFYSYRLSTVVHASRELSVYREVPTLYLTNDYTGCAEVGSLFLHANHRRGGLGRLLSKSRFVFLGAFASRFPDKLIAEMRGVSDAEGNSPLWDGLGRHFFFMPFPRADFLSGTRGKTFIAELMPHNPIYVPLLPQTAQDVIGKVHQDTRAALRLLEEEGFRHEGYVDIFDGGPTVEVRISEIDAVRHSAMLQVSAGSPRAGAPECIIATPEWEHFRCTLAPLQRFGDEAIIAAEVLEALGVENGQTVCAVPCMVMERDVNWEHGDG